MSPLLLVSTAVIMLASLSAVVFVWLNAGRWLKANTGYLTSFSAGVFLVVAAQLIRHTVHKTKDLWFAILVVVLAALFVYALFAVVPFFHHHHDDCIDCDENHSKPSAYRILFADGLHNIGDGILLVVSFSVSSAAGLAAAFGVLVHEIVQEISEFFVLRQAGLSARKSLLYNFLVSGTILFGIVLASLLSQVSTVAETVLFGLAAGSFLVVVCQDLIPHQRNDTINDHHVRHALWFAGGTFLMLTTLLGFPH